MRAFVMAAGRGVRLRPLTDTVPKPLIDIHGHHLWDWQWAALKRAGITEAVINTAHLADAFVNMPDELKKHGFQVQISREGSTYVDALESLGGIVKALPLITKDQGDTPFLVLAGDVVHNYDFQRLMPIVEQIQAGIIDAHLVCVPNPEFHCHGDMTVTESGQIIPGSGPHTYACIMVVSPRMFDGLDITYAKLFPWLWQFAENGRMTAEVFDGFWANVGSPEELEKLRNFPEALQWAKF